MESPSAAPAQAGPDAPQRPRRVITAKMAAAKRKAREAKSNPPKQWGGVGWLISAALMAAASALIVAAYRAAAPLHRPLTPSIVTAERVWLPDGRHMAVHEMGAAASSAKHHVLVLHDVGGCRLSMLPNITQAWLLENDVRLVSFDRPGYGQSDALPSRNATTEAQDVEWAASSLKLPRKFHVVSLGGGGFAALALLHNIPHRLAGVALVSPVFSPQMDGIPTDVALDAWASLPRSVRLPYFLARLGPWGSSALAAATKTLGPVPNDEAPAWLRFDRAALESLRANVPRWMVEALTSVAAVAGVLGKAGEEASPRQLAESDVSLLQSEDVVKFLNRTETEAHLQGIAESDYRDMTVISRGWGFGLEDLGRSALKSGTSKGEHVKTVAWYGNLDRISPPTLVKYAAKVMPHVEEREVAEAGHYFFFESEAWPKRILADLLRPDVAKNDAEVSVEESIPVPAEEAFE